jgi:hypothetical protein
MSPPIHAEYPIHKSPSSGWKYREGNLPADHDKEGSQRVLQIAFNLGDDHNFR